MAGSMRKMAVYLGLVEDDPVDVDEYDDYEAPREARREVRPVPAESRSVETRSVRTVRYDDPPAAAPERAPRPAAPAAPTADNYRITALHPSSYNDARRIGEEFRDGTPVIMNLTEMGDGDAKRIVDFAAGLVFAQRGTIERVTSKVFLLSPANVDVGQETKDRIAEGGFFNQS